MGRGALLGAHSTLLSPRCSCPPFRAPWSPCSVRICLHVHLPPQDGRGPLISRVRPSMGASLKEGCTAGLRSRVWKSLGRSELPAEGLNAEDPAGCQGLRRRGVTPSMGARGRPTWVGSKPEGTGTNSKTGPDRPQGQGCPDQGESMRCGACSPWQCLAVQAGQPHAPSGPQFLLL